MNNQKQKLVCLSIDSEHYSELCVDIVEDIDDAVKTLLHRESNEGDGLSVSMSKDGVKTRITLSDGNLDDEYFVVAEVMPACKDYVVAWWHAYDGVGFDLKGGSDDKAEAADALRTYVDNYWKGEYDDIDVHRNDSTYLIVDTGNEWEGIALVDLKEAA